jgi:glycosyltransferase involved in cell wall biosynthesis
MGVIKNPLVLSLLSMLEYISYHSAQRLIGLSPGIVAGIVRRGVPQSRVSLIPNGCDHDIFHPNGDSWRPAGIGADDFLAVFTGAHGIANGLDAVIDTAIELQQRRRSEIKMLLVGDGMKKKHLQARAAAHGLTNVVFHDAVHKAQLAALLRGADLGLQLLANVPAFYYGTSPNKFFDYIAAGLPVLTNYPGWIADLVEKNDIGFVATADDPKQFADKLEVAARDRSALRAKGARAKELARMEFHRDKFAADFVACLEHVRKQPS